MEGARERKEVQRRWPTSEDPTGSGPSVTEGYRGGRVWQNSKLSHCCHPEDFPSHDVASDPDPFISCLVSTRTCGKYHLCSLRAYSLGREIQLLLFLIYYMYDPGFGSWTRKEKETLKSGRNVSGFQICELDGSILIFFNNNNYYQ